MGLAYLCNGLDYHNNPPKFIVMAIFLPLLLALLMINHVRFAVPYGCEWGQGLGARAGQGLTSH